MNWKEIDLFKGIDLNDSFVVSWHRRSNAVIFEIEASIWPESKYYERPETEEYTCYKSATLAFKNISEVSGLLEMVQVKPSIDASGQTDYGNIDDLEQNSSGFSLEGEFGSVSVVGGEICFEIKET